jgi:hypothetical protein
MAFTLIVHVMNEDPFVAEMEALPESTDQAIVFSNPRRRDGKPVHYFDREATTFYFPWHRITFLEVLAPSRTRDELVEFFRD